MVQALHYGSHTHRISRPEEGVAFDLFLTKPYESTRRAERLPHASSVFAKPKSISKKSLQPVHATEPKKKPAATNKSSTSSGLDSDIEALQNGLAAHSAARDRYVFFLSLLKILHSCDADGDSALG